MEQVSVVIKVQTEIEYIKVMKLKTIDYSSVNLDNKGSLIW